MITVIQGKINYDGISKIGVVTSRWNSEVIEKLETEALKRLQDVGVPEDKLMVVRVPGAIEIPLAVKQLIGAGCGGVIALGCVIRGETSHYDVVCNAVERGCSELQLKHNTPVALGVLTTEDKDQALARAGGAKENKGRDVVDVVLEMMNLKVKLS